MSISKTSLIISFTGFLLLGVLLGNLWGKNSSNKYDCTSKFLLLKPNVDCESSDVASEKLQGLEDKIKVTIQGYKNTGKVKRASVFVRDLNTSKFLGVNDTDVYFMASLLKTPLLIGGFKLAEVEPKVLDQEIIYTGTPNFYDEQIIKSNEVLEVGKSYTIRDLMRRSIVYSDNTASQILYDFYPKDFLDRILQALAIQHVKTTGETENLVTARSYAGIFRILYNASYLTEKYSNEALAILTETAFQDGATSKLPQGTIVAHKFAERTLVNPDNQVVLRQFHECGIVYAKKATHPYSFCIMTEGDDYESLEKVLADVSLSIYEGMIGED